MHVGKQQGFTLIEVVFALALFALGALAALGVASQHIRSVTYLEERAFALQVASNLMADVMAGNVTGNVARNTSHEARQKPWPPKDGEQGEVEFATHTWYWEQTVLETVTADLRQVTLRVRREENGTVLAELQAFVGRR